MDSSIRSIQSAFWTNAPVVIGVIALLFAVFFYFRVKGLKDGDENMNRIAGYIREGAMAFLMRQYQVLAVFCAVVFVLVGVSLAGSPRARLSSVLSSRCSPASSA